MPTAPTPAGLASYARARGAPPLAFSYAPSPTVDTNLLILLHGLGDSREPFARLGTQLQRTLPQTAVLAANAPRRIPLLEEDAWMWWDSFDALGELIRHPDPRDALGALTALVGYLVECGWPPARIHLFGYAQGGTLALETLIHARSTWELGSAVSAAGPLLSLPTFAPPVQTPVLLIVREPPRAAPAVAAARRAFAHLTTHTYGPGGMVAGAEWPDVFAFWARVLTYRSRWELDGSLVPL